MMMTKLFIYSQNCLTPPPPHHPLPTQPTPSSVLIKTTIEQRRVRRASPVSAAKSGGGFSLNSVLKRCETCQGKGAIDCQGCKVQLRTILNTQSPTARRATTTTTGNSRRHVNYVGTFHVHASISSQDEGPSKRERPPPDPGIDTRIHWDNEDEGWIGGSSSTTSSKAQQQVEQEQHNNIWGNKFADLLDDSADSHYQFLGVSAEADLEEIKAAYRKLSKEYHPDTTSLPLKTASDKFVRLREIYDVLSNEESRRFYNWTLAQEATSRQAEIMRMRLEDPYVKEVETYEPVPDMVDRLGGRNMALGDQAVTALTIDVFIIIFAICCIVYVIMFKEPYY